MIYNANDNKLFNLNYLSMTGFIYAHNIFCVENISCLMTLLWIFAVI